MGAPGTARGEAGGAFTLAGWSVRDDGGLRLELTGAAGPIRAEVSIGEDGTLRLRAGRELPPPHESGLAREPWRPAPAAARPREHGGASLAHEGPLGALRVEMGASPFTLRAFDRNGNELARLGNLELSPGGGARISCAALPGERLFGFGERNGSLDKRGEDLRFRCRDPQLRRGGERYVSIPFCLGLSPAGGARGLLLDSLGPTRIDAACGRPDRLLFETAYDGLDLCFLPGPAPGDVVRRLTARVGRAPLPPRWALGHHQSRWSYASEKEVRALAAEMRRRGFPTDAIHLDIDYMDGFRVFTWNAKRFPDPARLISDLAEKGLRVVTIIDPGVKVDAEYAVYREGNQRRLFCRNRDGTEYRLRVWPGEAALPDFNREEVRSWWGGLHRGLLEAGVAGIWNDMNEPAGWAADLRIARLPIVLRNQDTSAMLQADPRAPEQEVEHERVRNVYGQQECRATREFLETARPATRPFLLTRSGGPGIQRHAAVWTGDNSSRWSDLRESIPMLLNLSLSGVPFCGADIGGFSRSCSPELFARWIQIGALQPFARTHSMVLTRRQEPWRFGPRVEAIARSALELRMRLMPYLYGLFRQAEADGAPPWRPLFWEFPGDDACAAVEDQLLLGPSLLVAPVLERGAREREVLIPPGRWFDWYDDAAYVGPRRIVVSAPLERLPVFVRAGSILTTQSAVLHAGEAPAEPCILEVAPGADGSALLVEDDGETTAYREGAVAHTQLRLWHRAGGRLRLEISRREGAFEIGPRPLRVVVRGCPPATSVRLDGRPLAAGAARPGYGHEAARLHAHFQDSGAGHVLEIEPAP